MKGLRNLGYDDFDDILRQSTSGRTYFCRIGENPINHDGTVNYYDHVSTTVHECICCCFDLVTLATWVGVFKDNMLISGYVCHFSSFLDFQRVVQPI